MNKQDVIAFFDRAASGWDADMVKSDAIIGKILDNAEIAAGQDVLDVNLWILIGILLGCLDEVMILGVRRW